MNRTPGFIVPSTYSSNEELVKDLKRRDKAAGFTPFEVSNFAGDAVVHYGIKGMPQRILKNDPSEPSNYSIKGIKRR